MDSAKQFADLAAEEVVLYTTKNAGYRGGANALGNFDRSAAIAANYPTFPWATPEGVLIAYALKHWDNVLANLEVAVHGNGEPAAAAHARLHESLTDLAVYVKLLRLCLYRRLPRS